MCLRSSKGTLVLHFNVIFNLSWSFFRLNYTFNVFLSPSHSMRSSSRASRSLRFPILLPTRDGVTRKKESKRRRSEGGRKRGRKTGREGEGGVNCSWKEGEVEVVSEAWLGFNLNCCDDVTFHHPSQKRLSGSEPASVVVLETKSWPGIKSP